VDIETGFLLKWDPHYVEYVNHDVVYWRSLNGSREFYSLSEYGALGARIFLAHFHYFEKKAKGGL
jgi:hypothetical protein